MIGNNWSARPGALRSLLLYGIMAKDTDRTMGIPGGMTG
ncbi:hypothetical protein CLOBOL_01696 [Enterocloster bolteae ATCC BAA-613]|uniref:Uncharacterized protein n=1 Tax=Enterocloster bolteae (strain ATCC BAA-613 / DSM 15670 / CCUG 46953 / JCM 12243 / WAL 16351) TaxID=411902 RepID=A8RLP8_ENTBW|nr:hypothetical protein CLOBOL_01696 [Enterocloster bolteae ATCC BAA-613]